ncbi:MAG: ribosome biogenesis/translation initiation ATPase RLI, partial [Methanomassiliicoccales archaeon]
TREEVLEHFDGTELHDYLKRLFNGKITTSLKPQYVDKLPRVHQGMVRDLLDKVAERMTVEEAVELMDLSEAVDRDIAKLSGGELQRVALAATMLKDSDVYFFDEPSSYLDIYQRIKVARAIRDLSQEREVMVIEHDLAILDFLADNVYLVYGSEGAFGVFAHPRQVRTSINAYLDGYLREENIRFRETKIEFETHPPRQEWETGSLIEYGRLGMDFDHFALEVEPGRIKMGETVGVVGPNAIGKTTFVKMLAGVMEPTRGEVDGSVQVSYKPQYIDPDLDGTVRELFLLQAEEFFDSGFFETEVSHPLALKHLFEKRVKNLSGGELQRAAIALCLARDADLYLLDEPSAYLDSSQRMQAAKTVRRVMEKRGRSGLVVDHDTYFIDMVSDSLMVFSGEPGESGTARGPFHMREGMNMFLRELDITFRRDNETRRPRINKPESRLDREQKSKGEYYYSE